jgi:hypothetical protein
MKHEFFLIAALSLAFVKLHAQDAGSFELNLSDSLSLEATSITACRDGGYLLTGYKEMGEVSYTITIVDEDDNYLDAEAKDIKTNAWVWKIDKNGKVVWEKNIGEATKNTEAHDAVVCHDGGYAIACRENEFGGVASNYALAKIDQEGNLLWKERHLTSSDDTPKNLKQCADSTFIIMGNSVWLDYLDILLVKMQHVDEDAYYIDGHPEAIRDNPEPTIWELRYTEELKNQDGLSLILDGMGGCVIVGSTMMGEATGYDALLLHIDEKGKISREIIEKAPLAEDMREIARTKDGDFIVCGSDFNNDIFESSFWIKKMNEKEETLWEYTSEAPMFLDALGLYRLTNGNYATGYSSSIGEGEKWEFVYLEISPGGKVVFEKSTELADSHLIMPRGFVIGAGDRCILAGTKTTPDYDKYVVWVKELNCGK